MRLKSDIWVKAFVRRCYGAGVPAMIVSHGDDAAGAIYIKVSRLDGTADLYGPAPASLDDDADGGERRWSNALGRTGVADAEIEAYLARQRKFDSDIWIVEIEDRQGRHFLEGWLAPG